MLWTCTMKCAQVGTDSQGGHEQVQYVDIVKEVYEVYWCKEMQRDARDGVNQRQINWLWPLQRWRAKGRSYGKFKKNVSLFDFSGKCCCELMLPLGSQRTSYELHLERIILLWLMC